MSCSFALPISDLRHQHLSIPPFSTSASPSFLTVSSLYSPVPPYLSSPPIFPPFLSLSPRSLLNASPH
ncbi:hypothetical protein CesoFtcFv8_000837 [Champsocephalus esox]|uniref:Uncharacterized protein n=1 Tax=Champsocephalus esox TaxID=159716 RepID=A0AAN8D2F2_9TELE|nr:hypothetical protein CesoFtcFv8_000837 [Champsocephalus esox]